MGNVAHNEGRIFFSEKYSHDIPVSTLEKEKEGGGLMKSKLQIYPPKILVKSIGPPKWGETTRSGDNRAWSGFSHKSLLFLVQGLSSYAHVVTVDNEEGGNIIDSARRRRGIFYYFHSLFEGEIYCLADLSPKISSNGGGITFAQVLQKTDLGTYHAFPPPKKWK